MPDVNKADVEQDISWLGARLREPSSYAGVVGMLLAYFHIANSTDLQTSIISILVGLGGLIAFVLPEKGSKSGSVNPLGMGAVLLVGALAAAFAASFPLAAHAQSATTTGSGTLAAPTLPPIMTKGPSAPALFTGYVKGGCGMYYGLNTIGGASAVNGAPVGTSIIQGGVGATLGYGCPIDGTAGDFWFAEGNFDWANINGSTPGFNLTGPAHFEQRIGLGSPISNMLSMFPGVTQNLAVPNLQPLPTGITAGPSYPFIFAALHEQDISAQLGLASSREWLISPGLGIGLQTRLSNDVVAETAVQWVLQSNGFAVGPQKVSLGNGAEVSFTLKY